MGIQSLIQLAYPPRCIACGAMVDGDFALCGPCWRDTPFISGLVCTGCGTPLPGESDGEERCDDCLTIARPWVFGTAAFLYRDTGRKMVLAFKHGDRTDLARPAAGWLANRLRDRLPPDTLVVPVPAHWRRRVARRYNQAALLAHALARALGTRADPLVLHRLLATPVQDGLSRDARFANVSGAVVAAPDAGRRIAGRPVLVVDDVMTSGATMAAAAEACSAAGACQVYAAAMARVAKND